MGYTTDFSGSVSIVPPLNAAEIDYLTKFAGTRRMNCTQGPYYVDRGGDSGQDFEDKGIINYNKPPEGQPGLWCQWVPTENGTAIEWDGGEKFYSAEDWMTYIIDHFLKPGAHASALKILEASPFHGFTFDHKVNGTIYAQGEDPDDRWRLNVEDNVVTVQQGTTTYA